MTEHAPAGPDAGSRLVRLDDGDMHVAQDGKPGAPALLLIQNAAAPLACWDTFVPHLAGAHRVDLLGPGSPASPADRYDIRAQARRVGTALDSLGASQVTVVGHSSGCTVATALAEQRPGTAATSPITRQSGKRKTVMARYVHNDRLRDALDGQAFAALTPSPGARACYDAQRAAGAGHRPALRHLANRLVGILHGCLKSGTRYDEATAWPGHASSEIMAAA